MKTMTLQNEILAVELDGTRPVVLGYQHRPTGTRMDGARPDGALTVNGKPCGWSEWAISVVADKSHAACTYDASHAEKEWRLRYCRSWKFR